MCHLHDSGLDHTLIRKVFTGVINKKLTYIGG